MAKRSGRHLSKKNLPAGVRRITENGKRIWAFGDLRFTSLNNFYMKRSLESKSAEDEKPKE